MKLTSVSTIRYIMEKYNFKFSKTLGQNFLIDDNIIEKIIKGADITEEDYILEIGPGIGVMTSAMADIAKKVVAIEIDTSLLEVLDETLADYENIKIINGDVLKLDLNKIIEEEFNGKKPKVVANLPYYVTTPIIMKLLEEDINVSDIVVMVQKEVAQRIISKPSTKSYGVLSVAVQYYSSPSIICMVPRGVFMPKPNVDSSVIRLEIRKDPTLDIYSKDIFFKTLRAAFAMRRKTLLNTLSSSLKISKDEIKSILEKCEIDPKRRGETLSISEFAKLSNIIAKR